jgi:hypothetical protein
MANTDNVTGAAIEATGKLVENIYADVASPSARRVGSALDTLFKVGLSPVALLDWGFERSKDWLASKLEERLAQTPLDFQQHPPSQVAIPILLAIAASGDSEALRSLYAELLLKSTDTRTEADVHPSYVAVLGQLTPQEALVFISFRDRTSGSLFIDQPRAHRHLQKQSIEEQFREHCVGLGLQAPNPQLWLDNFLRLRLVELNTYTDTTFREPEYDWPHPSIDTKEERHLTITEYGAAFIEACAPPPAASAP